GIDMGLDLSVQCERNTVPRRPSDGATVAQGPLRPVIGIHNLPITDAPVYYTAFTRRLTKGEGNGRFVYSPGVSTQLWYADAAQLRPWVEREALVAADMQQIPMRVGMVLGALDVHTVAESLLASQTPRVRAWGLRRVEQAVRQGW